MRIAVYSGSFNPLHIGHQAIMEYLTLKKDFDWVYLVVSPKNPLKDGISGTMLLSMPLKDTLNYMYGWMTSN